MFTRIVTGLIPDMTTLEFISVCIIAFAYGISTDQNRVALSALITLVVWFAIIVCYEARNWFKKNWHDRPSYSRH